MADFLVKIGPLLGGAVVLAICLVSIVRNPAVSNMYALMLGFGGLLFAIPTFTNISFKSSVFEFTGQATPIQVATQGAEIKGTLSDIKLTLDTISKRLGAPASVAASPEISANRQSLILIFYFDPQKEIAQKMENFLLRKGYSVNAVYTDFTEVPSDSVGPRGSIRFVYTDNNEKEALAKRIKSELAAQQEFQEVKKAELKAAPKLSAADVQIRLF